MKWGTGAHEHDLYALLLDVAAQQRDAATIQKHAAAAEQSARQYDHSLYLAIIHRAIAVAHRLSGEYAESETRLEQALALFKALNAHWQLGRTCVEYGELQAAQENMKAARDFFERALAEFEKMRATPQSAKVRARLLELESK